MAKTASGGNVRVAADTCLHSLARPISKPSGFAKVPPRRLMPPEKKSPTITGTRASSGQFFKTPSHKQKSMTRYAQKKSFVLSHSHGANLTKQHARNTKAEGKNKSRSICFPSRTNNLAGRHR